MSSSTMIYQHFTVFILILLSLLRGGSGVESELQQPNQHASQPAEQSLAINVQSDDLEAVESNIQEAIIKPDEVISETIKHRIPVSTPSPVRRVMSPAGPQGTKTPIKQIKTIVSVSTGTPHAQRRLSAKEEHIIKNIPMYFRIIKKIEYGQKKIQRRQGQGYVNEHRVIMRPVHYQHSQHSQHSHKPHNVKFYIQPSHLKGGPKGGKVYLPVVPKQADKPKWSLPVHAHKPSYSRPTPHSYVQYSSSIPKKTKGFGYSFTPAHIPLAGGQHHGGHFPQYEQHHQGQSVSHYEEEHPHFEVESHGHGHGQGQEHVYPGWSQEGAHHVHPSSVVPELPEWAQQEAAFEIDSEGFSPVALPQVYPQHAPPKYGPGPSFENFDPSIYSGFPQGNQGYPQMPHGYQIQSQQGPSHSPQSHQGQQYAVQEQTFDVPPPRGPARRPPGSPVAQPQGHQGPLQTPGLSASAPAAAPQMMTQAQLQMQYDQLNQGPTTGDIDYSAYQPKPIQIGANAAQTQHGPPAQVPVPEHPKHYPALSSIQDYSPNYLREEGEHPEYNYEEESQEEHPGIQEQHSWAYQPSQADHSQHSPPHWAHQIPEHIPNFNQNPNLQASYAWRQKTQDGKLIQVTQNAQESRTEVTKLKPNSPNTPNFPNHAPTHHEVVKKQVKDDDNDLNSHEVAQGQVQVVPTQAAQIAPPVSVAVAQKDSMISNGWTPIINS